MCVKSILKFCRIKTRLDVIMLVTSLFLAGGVVVFKLFPHKFGIDWTKNKTQIHKVDLMHGEDGKILTKQEGKEKFFKMIGKTDGQILTDEVATVYLRSAWLIPQVLPGIFNSSIAGGYYNLTLMSTYAVSHGMKTLFHKKRPDGSNYKSFPSGHTSGTVVLGGFLHRFYGAKIGVPFYALGLATGISRIYCNRHDVYDVVGGFVVGGLCGYYTNFLLLLVINFIAARIAIVKKIKDFVNQPIKI